MRREQIALHAVGKELQCALPLLARRHMLALLLQALGNPLRQGRALDGVDLKAHATVVQRTEPGPLAGGKVQPGQHEQRER